MGIIERVQKLISETSKSERDFAIKVGITPATLNLYTTGRREISFKTLSAIFQAYPTLSANWLIKGEGNMYDGSEVNITPGSTEITDEAFFKRIIDEQLDTISMLKNRVSELEERLSAQESKSITA